MRRGVGVALIGMLLVAGTARGESLLAVDYVFVQSPTGTVFGDHFDQGALGSQWLAPTGQPPFVGGTTAQFDHLDHIISTPVLPHGVDLTVAALLHEDLPVGQGEYGFLVIYGASHEDFIAVGLSPNGVFVTDEDLGGIAVNGFGGGDAGVAIHISANNAISVDVNDTEIFSDPTPDFGPISAVGLLVIPEPATICLLLVSALAIPRRLAVTRRWMS